VVRPRTQEVPLKRHLQGLDWNPQGKRKEERPKQTWRSITDAEVKAIGTAGALEESCCGPMFFKESKGFSKQASI